MTGNSTPRQDHWSVLRTIREHEEFYLERWSLLMRRAGYLEHTTAKRVDCIQALEEFLSPILAHHETGVDEPQFAWLITHEGDWGRPLIESARRHRMRGVTSAMFLGCFKTFIHSLLDVVEQMPEAGQEAKITARRHIRLYGDALEVLYVQDWSKTLPGLMEQRLDEANRLLTLEKCRFENILNSASDLILVVDGGGTVTNVNTAMKQAASEEAVMSAPVWEALGLEGQSMEELLKYYPVGISCEMAPFGDGKVYRMQINPLSSVSMANSDQHMIMLTNVTAHATQREILEDVVAQKTEALRREKEQLEEMNITLRNVLQSIDKERKELFGEVSEKINHLVIPALDRIEDEDDTAIRKGYITVAKDQLARLAPGSGTSDPMLLKLTHMETRVCQFIQSGHSSKDIAHSLNLSIETVQTHRKNIRRKLGLHGRSVSLYAHLKTMGLNS